MTEQAAGRCIVRVRNVRDMKLRTIIARLEKQQRDLKEILAALRAIDRFGPDTVPRISLDEYEKRLVASALERAGGNQTEAARILKISRDRLRYKIAKHGLTK
jgi:DNA-binding NtrC family response regulator